MRRTFPLILAPGEELMKRRWLLLLAILAAGPQAGSIARGAGLSFAANHADRAVAGGRGGGRALPWRGAKVCRSDWASRSWSRTGPARAR